MKKKSSIVCILLIIALIITGILIVIKKNSLIDQNGAKRWSDERMEQLSIFYPVTMTADMSELFFEDLAHQIQGKLDEAAYVGTGITDERGIAFPYAVSVAGHVSIECAGKTVDTAVIGIEQRFFAFHPVDLIYGSYLSANDLMDDGIIIDNITAWNIFGSSDVVGKQVSINGVPHYIRGVTKKKSDRVSMAAGLDKTLCYMSLNSLKKYGSTDGSYCYEVILPNPVDDFANNIIGETLGDSVKELVLVNNTHRYDMSECLSKLKQIGIRSMSTKGIVFPYFENEARAHEDLLAICYGLQVVFAVTLIIILCIRFIQFRRTKTYKRWSKKIRPKAPWKWKIWDRIGKQKVKKQETSEGDMEVGDEFEEELSGKEEETEDIIVNLEELL